MGISGSAFGLEVEMKGGAEIFGSDLIVLSAGGAVTAGGGAGARSRLRMVLS